MITFRKQFGNDRLFAAEQVPGEFWLVLPEGYAGETISLETAWSSTELLANFGYTAGSADVTAGQAEQFVQALLRRVITAGPARGFVWLAHPTAWQSGALDDASAPLLGLDEAGTQVQTGLSAPIVPGVRLTVANQSPLAFDVTQVTVTGTVTFAGARAPVAAPPAATAVLALDGAGLGTLAFRIYLQRQSLLDDASWGFQFLYPATEGPLPAAYEWLPLAAGSPAGSLGFDSVIDPSDPVNALAGPNPPRSLLVFTGQNADGSPSVLDSAYRTAQGAGVRLTPVTGPGQPNPAALVFNGGAPLADNDEQSQLAPAGDFTLSVPDTEQTVAALLCGIAGTELIGFQPERGDRMRFTPYQPAFAPKYPFAVASPVAAPPAPDTPLLDATFTTSWAQIVPGDGGSATPYVAQPKGAALYGHDNPVWQAGTGLMGWEDTADALPPGVPFPLVPYSSLSPGAMTFTATAMADFERQVIGPTRRGLIGTAGDSRSHGAGAGEGPRTVATPAGQVATVDGGRWTRILLAQTLDPLLQLAFDNPPAALQQAFQTSDLFLVAASAAELGAFSNTMQVAGWSLTADVGAGNRYNDYRNVMLVKGRKGRLYDLADPAGSLVSNPERWTQREQFAIPSDLVSNPDPPPDDVPAPPDPAEQVILSQWLQDYFARAAQATDEGLARFNTIAADENWTGILVLRADISGVPSDLAGITAGITDPAQFNAHHLGIEITPLTSGPSGPEMDGASSVFGLIDYTDPQFTPPEPGEPVQPLPPTTVTEYDYRLLSLKVVFVNSAVRSFSSYAQLTTTAWFGMPVDHMGDGSPYPAIVLPGTLQDNNGRPVYGLVSTADTMFFFDDSVAEKLEVTNAAMVTVSAGDAEVSSWFGLSGYLDFKALQAASQDGDGVVPFDLFSFGSDPGQPDAPRRGLAFTNLGIAMTYPADDPASRVLALDTSGIRFDVATSTPRPGSLFRQFALEVGGIMSGTADTPPAKLGYASAVTDARLTGVDGDAWWGIDYQLTLGTPGNLAGKVGLSAHLLTAWSPASGSPAGAEAGYRAVLGLQLPGTGGGANLISLQTVLKLSLGQIWLKRDPSQGAFLLLFTEIALKVFGLLSIPPGSTLFYLYGNPGGTGSPSGLAWYAMYRKEGTGQ